MSQPSYRSLLANNIAGIYKNITLQRFYYAGLLRVSCNRNDKTGLQVARNAVLRMCFNIQCMSLG